MNIYLLSHTRYICSTSGGYICLVATELHSADTELFPVLQKNMFSWTSLNYFLKTMYAQLSPKSCPTFWDPMASSTPGSSVLHYLQIAG